MKYELDDDEFIGVVNALRHDAQLKRDAAAAAPMPMTEHITKLVKEWLEKADHCDALVERLFNDRRGTV